MTIFVKIDEIDPLDLIVKNKEIVRHLRGNGINGQSIREILEDWRPKMEFPIATTKCEKQAQKEIDYAMRHLKALVGNKSITDKEVKALVKIYNRLYHEHMQWEKDKTGKPVYKMTMSKNTSKTQKQMLGRQVAAINKYIKPFNKMYLQREIYSLIAELLETWHNSMQKFSQDEIANFDKNNY